MAKSSEQHNAMNTVFQLQEDRYSSSRKRAFVPCKKFFKPRNRYFRLSTTINEKASYNRYSYKLGIARLPKRQFVYVPSFLPVFESQHDDYEVEMAAAFDNIIDKAFKEKLKQQFSRHKARILCTEKEDPAVKLFIKNERTNDEQHDNP